MAYREMAAGFACCCAATFLENERKRSSSRIVAAPSAVFEGSGHLSPEVSPSGRTAVTVMTESDVRDRPTISSGTRYPTEACSHAAVGHRGPELRALPAAIDRCAFQGSVAPFASLRLCVECCPIPGERGALWDVAVPGSPQCAWRSQSPLKSTAQPSPGARPAADWHRVVVLRNGLVRDRHRGRGP
jgi:hypothetical protein